MLLPGGGRVQWVGVFMYESARPKAATVIGPFGPLTIADLPSPGPQRWNVRRKAEVITAVRGGLLSLEEACSRYALDIEEYCTWEHRIDRYGLAGLRTTRAQLYLTNDKPKRSRRGCSPDRQANGHACGTDTTPSTICESISNSDCGKLFTVVDLGSGFMGSGSNDFCKDSSDVTSTDTFCMNGECGCDFNIAWFGTRTIVRVSGSIMGKSCDI
jgi:Protein of unknown function (DUF1153)